MDRSLYMPQKASDPIIYIRTHLETHATSTDGLSATRHGSRSLDELAIDGDDSPALAKVKGPAGGGIKIGSHEGVANAEVDGRSNGGVSGADEIEQPGSTLRCLHGAIVSALLGLVQSDEVGPPKVVLAQEGEATLSTG